jgi:hypothetical protein
MILGRLMRLTGSPSDAREQSPEVSEVYSEILERRLDRAESPDTHRIKKL